MPEGLSPSEVGKEIRDHAAHEAQHVSDLAGVFSRLLGDYRVAFTPD
jgi:hypothetical protein